MQTPGPAGTGPSEPSPRQRPLRWPPGLRVSKHRPARPGGQTGAEQPLRAQPSPAGFSPLWPPIPPQGPPPPAANPEAPSDASPPRLAEKKWGGAEGLAQTRQEGRPLKATPCSKSSAHGALEASTCWFRRKEPRQAQQPRSGHRTGTSGRARPRPAGNRAPDRPGQPPSLRHPFAGAAVEDVPEILLAASIAHVRPLTETE